MPCVQFHRHQRWTVRSGTWRGGGVKNNGKENKGKKEGGGVTLIGKHDFRWKHIFQLRSCKTKCAA